MTEATYEEAFDHEAIIMHMLERIRMIFTVSAKLTNNEDNKRSSN